MTTSASVLGEGSRPATKCHQTEHLSPQDQGICSKTLYLSQGPLEKVNQHTALLESSVANISEASKWAYLVCPSFCF